MAEPDPEATQADKKPRTPAAERALAEAAARRADAGQKGEESRPSEQGGRTGPDPVRYGDWENKGIASDF